MFVLKFSSTPVSFGLVVAGCSSQSERSEYFFWAKYEYEYICNVLFNTNTNIFGINFWTEYEYEYIRDNQVDRIRIFEYFGLEYSNIIWRIFEYYLTNIRIFHKRLIWVLNFVFPKYQGCNYAINLMKFAWTFLFNISIVQMI